MENIFVEFLPPWVLTGRQPAFYDKESGTVLQQTARMYDRVNMLVRMFNKLSKETKTVVEDYINQFNELHDYVQDYFDNLDVQEEINNKLDDLVEDGTMQTLINNYLQPNVEWTFDNVADMKASTNFVDGSFARTLGYHAKGDNGGGLYKIREITVSDVVDEGYIIEISDTLIAELIYADVILPEQYGCYGDGTHDDTTQFKKLLTYVTANGLTLVGEGNYVLSEAITIGDINIIMPTATFTTNYGITLNNPVNKTLNFPKVISTESNANTGITLFEGYSNQVVVNYIYGFNIGFHVTSSTQGCVYNNITIGEIRNCLNSLVLEPTSDGWIAQNTFIGGRLFNTGTYITEHGSDIKLIYLKGNSVHGVNNNTFIGTCIEGNEGSSNGVKIKMEYATYNVFQNVRYEGTNPKVDATNSLNNYLWGGYYLNNVTFVNDPVAYEILGTSIVTRNAGQLGSVYQDIQVTGNSYPVLQCRNASGVVGAKILNNAFELYNTSNSKQVFKFDLNGITGYDTNDSPYIMIRPYAGHTAITNCDGTNHCMVITSGTNLVGGAYLWVYDGHLYGKIGSKPTTSTDGTQIL